MAETVYPDLASLEARLKTEWAGRDALIEEMRALRFMDKAPDVPAAYEAEVVRTPIAYQIVERIVGTLTADDPLITVPPPAETDKAQTQASRLEKGTMSILREIARQQGEDPLERFVECLVADGHGCMRMLYAPQIWHGMPRKKKGQNDEEYTDSIEEWKKGKPIPISWQWIDPLNVYPVWDEAGLAYVLESDKRDVATLNPRAWNVCDDLPELTDLTRADSNNETGMVTFQQLWTRDMLTYAVNGEVVHHQKHRYERPPYFYGFGISPSTTDRARRGLSVLYPLRNILPQFDRMLSQKATAVRVWCWPTPVLHIKSNQALLSQITNGQIQIESGVPRTIEIRPGQTVTLYEDEEIGFLTWQGNGPDADEMIALMQQMIQKAGLSDVMYGQSGSGDSGYLVNQLIAAARMKLKPIVTHAESAAEHMVQVLWDIVEDQIKQPLYAYTRQGKKGGWEKLDPEDMSGYRQVQIKINPLLPTDTYARSSQAINELRADLRDPISAMEEIGIEQPDEMERRVLWNKIKQTQPIMEIVIRSVAERYGLRMQEQEQQAQGMSPEQLQAMLPNLPPGLQQMLMAQMMGGQQQAPGGGPAVMAAPGVQAAPGPPVPQAGAGMMGQVGPQTRPAGIAMGRAPGAQRQGTERR